MDQILFWNDVALEANKISHTEGGSTHPGVNGPTLSSRALALVHLAMYDACKGTSTSGYFATKPYYHPAAVAAVGSTSQEAAIAAAAHSMLSNLYPKLKGLFDEKHAAAAIPSVNFEAGNIYGSRIAQQIWALRKDDPKDSDDGFVASLGKGKHRPDPNNPAPNNAPFYGKNSKSLVVAKRWGLKPPPTVGSGDYNNALRQVIGKGIDPKQMGALPSRYSKRTAEETLIGIYWGYDGAKKLGTPPRLYNQILRTLALGKDIVTGRKTNQEENAELFAMANAAMGDAGILAWEQKYHHNFWRPVLGVREHDDSMGYFSPGAAGGMDADCDPCWLPLGAPKTNEKGSNDFTPPFPAYPSGHATFGAASLQIARRFYGISDATFEKDTLFDGLEFVSDEFNGVNMDADGTTRAKHHRKFKDGLWQMILENGMSRVFLGVHWYFDAFDVKNNAFKPGSTDGKDLDIKEIKVELDLADPNCAVGIGGVPLGVAIANDIFTKGLSSTQLASILP
jgi:hypothetical protein